jgi:hypothetical protein
MPPQSSGATGAPQAPGWRQLAKGGSAPLRQLARMLQPLARCSCQAQLIAVVN